MSTTLAPPTVAYEIEIDRHEGGYTTFAGKRIAKGETTIKAVRDTGSGSYRERAERAFFRTVAKFAKDDKVMEITLWLRRDGEQVEEILFFKRNLD